jgi:hypothetical protein
MKTLHQLELITVLALLSGPVAAEELYNLDFRNPEVGAYETLFGSPTVQSRVGSFRDALVFSATAGYEQIRLPIETAAPRINIQYDLLVHNMLQSPHTFTLQLDTDHYYHNVSLSRATSGRLSGSTFAPGDPLGIRVFQSFLAPLGEYVALWSDDEVYHFEISIDLETDWWSLAIDGEQVFSRAFNASSLSALRFNMGPPDLRTGSASPATYAVLDNLVITAVPEPSTFALVGLGLAGLAFARREESTDRESSRIHAERN